MGVRRIVVNGRPAAPARARHKIDITVPEGALSERRRDGLIADVTSLVLDACEPGERPADASMRVWVLVHEQPDGWWGAAGVSVQFARLRQFAAEHRNSEKQVG